MTRTPTRLGQAVNVTVGLVFGLVLVVMAAKGAVVKALGKVLP